MVKKSELPAVPSTLSAYALLDARTCAAAAGIGVSTFWEHVRLGRAPQPALRRPRLTRWREIDIKCWLATLSWGEYQSSDKSGAGRAKKASDAARVALAAKARCGIAEATNQS